MTTKTRNRFLASTAALAISASVAFGAGHTDSVIANLQEQGYTRIEVSEGPTQMKVEAIRGDEKLEIIYDLTTGAILKQEVEMVDSDDETSPGVEIDRDDEDFLDDEDDEEGDDEEDDESYDDEEDDDEDDDDEDDDDEDDDDDEEDDDDDDDDE